MNSTHKQFEVLLKILFIFCDRNMKYNLTVKDWSVDWTIYNSCIDVIYIKNSFDSLNSIFREIELIIFRKKFFFQKFITNWKFFIETIFKMKLFNPVFLALNAFSEK